MGLCNKEELISGPLWSDYKCACLFKMKTQDLWVKLGTLCFVRLKGHLRPWLVSKQTTLSSHLSQHIGSIATLSSMATTRSVVRVRWGLSMRACCVINSSNVLFFMLNPLGWLKRIHIHVKVTLVWSIHPFCYHWCFISSTWKVQHLAALAMKVLHKERGQ